MWNVHITGFPPSWPGSAVCGQVFDALRETPMSTTHHQICDEQAEKPIGKSFSGAHKAGRIPSIRVMTAETR